MQSSWQDRTVEEFGEGGQLQLHEGLGEACVPNLSRELCDRQQGAGCCAHPPYRRGENDATKAEIAALRELQRSGAAHALGGS